MEVRQSLRAPGVSFRILWISDDCWLTHVNTHYPHRYQQFFWFVWAPVSAAGQWASPRSSQLLWRVSFRLRSSQAAYRWCNCTSSFHFLWVWRAESLKWIKHSICPFKCNRKPLWCVEYVQYMRKDTKGLKHRWHLERIQPAGSSLLCFRWLDSATHKQPAKSIC